MLVLFFIRSSTQHEIMSAVRWFLFYRCWNELICERIFGAGRSSFCDKIIKCTWLFLCNWQFFFGIDFGFFFWTFGVIGFLRWKIFSVKDSMAICFLRCFIGFVCGVFFIWHSFPTDICVKLLEVDGIELSVTLEMVWTCSWVTVTSRPIYHLSEDIKCQQEEGYIRNRRQFHAPRRLLSPESTFSWPVHILQIF